MCRCGAYRFPHRMMGGLCDGGGFVVKFFENNIGGACRHCNCMDDNGYECQVESGREPPQQCPELQDVLRSEGVKLYGVNKPPPKRMGWRR